MAVRRGELPLEQVVADLLPEESDSRAVDAFLVRAYQRAWAESRPGR